MTPIALVVICVLAVSIWTATGGNTEVNNAINGASSLKGMVLRRSSETTVKTIEKRVSFI